MYVNDGTDDAPKLRGDLNTDNVSDLPADSVWPGLSGDAALTQLKRDGFEGFSLGIWLN